MNAFVLAGGQSRRMGRDKALLQLDGTPLIEHAMGTLRRAGFAPQIVGSRSGLDTFGPTIADEYPGAGPLGGIASALAAAGDDLNLFLAVDMPWLPPEFLRWLATRAQTTGALVTMPRLLGSPQPLCAVYRCDFLLHARNSLADGDAKVLQAVDRAARAVGEPIDSFDVEAIAAAEAWPHPRGWFANLNTPADFERALLEQTSRIQ